MSLAHSSIPAEDDDLVVRPASGGPAVPARSGRFSLEVATGAWWWSDETYRIHGFEPGEVVPTTRLVLAHKHPGDRERFRTALVEAWRERGSFVSVHRILAANGVTRHVVVTGRAEPDVEGPGRLTGTVVDVTAQVATAAAQLADEQIRRSVETRATIEQAKGILAAAWQTSPEAAFDRLRRLSMERNVPVRDLAADVVERACGGTASSSATRS